jgi:hypothetical protein
VALTIKALPAIVMILLKRINKATRNCPDSQVL